MEQRENRQPVLDIVIPVFNEEEGIPELLRRLQAFLHELKEVTPNVIFVDDHSRDASPRLLKQFCGETPGYQYIRLASNSGSHVATLAGLEYGRGDCAVFLAADLQDPPELIPQLLQAWRQGAQIVWAVRQERKGISWADKFFSRMFYRLINNMAHVKLPDQGSDFCLVDRKVLEALKLSVVANPFLIGEIARLGFNQVQILYTKGDRRFGHSKWNLARKFKILADAVISFSYTPIRAMSYLGLICSVLGFLFAFFTITRAIFGVVPIQGWASLIVIVLLLGGVQMIMLGMLGEYMWRTLEIAKRRPLYILEEEKSMQPENDPRT